MTMNLFSLKSMCPITTLSVYTLTHVSAQLYFGVSTNDLANAYYDEDGHYVAVPDVSVYRPYPDIEIEASDDTLPEGVFVGASLSLKSRTTLSIYFTSDQPLTFSCDGMTVEKQEADGYQIARIRDIPAVMLSDAFTLTVNGQDEVHYSPLNYCKKVLTTEGVSSKLKDVASALYTYSHLSDYYFGKKQPEALPEPEEA